MSVKAVKLKTSQVYTGIQFNSRKDLPIIKEAFDVDIQYVDHIGTGVFVTSDNITRGGGVGPSNCAYLPLNGWLVKTPYGLYSYTPSEFEHWYTEQDGQHE